MTARAPIGSAELTVFESVVFLDHFKDLPDIRMAGKVDYPMPEILLLCLAATISGASTVTAIAQFGLLKVTFLRRFRPFRNGTPAHDTLGDILASIDPEAFQKGFIAFVSDMIGAPVDAICLDGKTMRGAKKKGGKAAHVVSAFAARERLVLGQVKVNEKSNEITAIPALLDMLDVNGAIVTIDAMGCQKAIAAKIVEKNAEYILALKGNQSAMHNDVKTLVDEQRQRNFVDVTTTAHETVDGDHGRIETRRFIVIHAVEWLKERHKWPQLKAVVVVDSRREIDEKVETETRLFLTSSPLDAERLGRYVRGHWAIENSLHWVMDMTFRDDACRVRNGHGPINLATLRHASQNLLRRAPGKLSMNLKSYRAALDDDYRATVLQARKAA
jgi:predicted transposase YbfD/YdcC